VDDFHQCAVCRALVTGPHACSPFALGRIEFTGEGCRPAVRLTEADVRRIVREEIAKAMVGER
jgi:hypothetical protein